MCSRKNLIFGKNRDPWYKQCPIAQIAFDPTPLCQKGTMGAFLHPVFFLSDVRHDSRNQNMRSTLFQQSEWVLWKSTIARFVCKFACRKYPDKSSDPPKQKIAHLAVGKKVSQTIRSNLYAPPPKKKTKNMQMSIWTDHFLKRGFQYMGQFLQDGENEKKKKLQEGSIPTSKRTRTVEKIKPFDHS